MDEKRLWRLFFATGRPEVYLAILGERAEREALESPARTAFRQDTGRPRKL